MSHQDKQENDLVRENLSLYRQLAGAELDAKLGWQRYNAANKARLELDKRISEAKDPNNVITLFEHVISETPDAFLKATETNPVYQVTKEELLSFINKLI